LVDVLLGTELGATVSARLRSTSVHAPAHLDAEVLSALARLHRHRRVAAPEVARRLRLLGDAPIERHPLGSLLMGAWERRARLHLMDALYVALADQLSCPVITTDRRLARAAPEAELVEA
jgi:predicted nucleic acid-binding protein